jgi:hypothetical protein
MAVAEPEETMAADGGVDSYIRAYRKERLGGDVREAARMLGESDRPLSVRSGEPRVFTGTDPYMCILQDCVYFKTILLHSTSAVLSSSSFVLGAEGSDDEDVGDDGYWWWQSTEANAARWVVPQWEVLAACRGGWRAGLEGLRVNGSDVGVC